MDEDCCNTFKDTPGYDTTTGFGVSTSNQTLCYWTPNLYTYQSWTGSGYEDVTYDYGWCSEVTDMYLNGKSGAKCMDPGKCYYLVLLASVIIIIILTLSLLLLLLLLPASTQLTSLTNAGDSKEKCSCTKHGYQVFLSSEDAKCPHKSKCYLSMDQTCPKYTYNGLWEDDWDSRDEINYFVSLV